MLAASAPIANTSVPDPVRFLRSRKYMVQSNVATHRIKNQTTTPVSVTIYDCTPRKDGDAFGPIDAWNVGVNDQSVTLPGADNALTMTQIGTTPFQSRRFTTRWKVLKVTKTMLGGGAEHHHHISQKPRYLFNAEEETSFAVSRGTTLITFIVFHGGVVGTSGSAAPVSTTTSDATLEIVSSVRTIARMFERSLTSYVQWNNLGQLEDSAQFAVNEESDVIQPVTDIAA